MEGPKMLPFIMLSLMLSLETTSEDRQTQGLSLEITLKEDLYKRVKNGDFPHSPKEIEELTKEEIESLIGYYRKEKTGGTPFYTSVLKKRYTHVSSPAVHPYMLKYWYLLDILCTEQERRENKDLNLFSLGDLLREPKLIPFLDKIKFPTPLVLQERVKFPNLPQVQPVTVSPKRGLKRKGKSTPQAGQSYQLSSDILASRLEDLKRLNDSRKEN
jgi:hypothetical protein